MSGTILIYGATGYTGKLIAKAAAEGKVLRRSAEPDPLIANGAQAGVGTTLRDHHS